jgi:hypothetical protein
MFVRISGGVGWRSSGATTRPGDCDTFSTEGIVNTRKASKQIKHDQNDIIVTFLDAAAEVSLRRTSPPQACRSVCYSNVS